MNYNPFPAIPCIIHVHVPISSNHPGVRTIFLTFIKTNVEKFALQGRNSNGKSFLYQFTFLVLLIYDA